MVLNVPGHGFKAPFRARLESHPPFASHSEGKGVIDAFQKVRCASIKTHFTFIDSHLRNVELYLEAFGERLACIPLLNFIRVFGCKLEPPPPKKNQAFLTTTVGDPNFQNAVSKTGVLVQNIIIKSRISPIRLLDDLSQTFPVLNIDSTQDFLNKMFRKIFLFYQMFDNGVYNSRFILLTNHVCVYF